MADEPQQMEVEAPAPADAPKVHAPGEDSGLTTYPVALATQEAVVEDQQLFVSLLQDLNAKLQTAQPKKYRPSKYRVPTVAGRELNLHLLYQQVSKLGGAIAVTADNKWMDVVAPFNFTNKFNLSAIRKIYSSLLWHFEQVYQHKAAGQKLLEPPELPASAAADPAADGISTRPSRNRRGTSLAAIIAADNLDSDVDDEAVAAATAAPSGKAAAAAAKKAAAVEDGAAGKKEANSGAAAAAGDKPSAAAGGRQQQQRKQPAAQQQQQAQPQRAGSSGAAAAPAKTPELVGFLKAGKGRKDLTGQLVTGKVDAKFDCGYFVSLTIAGQSFNGILYCPTAVAAAAAAGASAQAAAAGRAAAAAVKREGSAAAPANGSAAVKREAAGAAEGDGRGGKRRRSQPVTDSAAKPKYAKTAFNFFAAEQWAVVKAELSPNAIPQEISRAVGEKWNRATEAERQPYIEKALEDKTRFEQEMQGWKAGFESPSAAAAVAAVDADLAGAATPTGAAAAAGVTGTPGKPPIGKGLFLAGGPGGPDAMDVDPDVQQQQPKHKLKFKPGTVGSLKPAKGQSPVADGAVADAAAAEGPAGVDQQEAGTRNSTPASLVEEAARHVASVAPSAVPDTAVVAAEADEAPAASAVGNAEPAAAAAAGTAEPAAGADEPVAEQVDPAPQQQEQQ